MLTPTTATKPIAHGRRLGLRSPYGATNGNNTNISPSASGKPMMNTFSMTGGINASSAKYHRKYQSGRGSACRLVGSAFAPSAGGPSQIARISTTEPTSSAKMTSFHPASGQNGTPIL